MKKLLMVAVAALLALGLAGCGDKAEVEETKTSLEAMDWEDIIEDASGTKVNFYGWGGSQLTNDWIDKELSSVVKEKYDIELNRVSMDIDEILNKLLNEKQVDADGTIDVVWINGENFYTAKTNDLLYGSFTDLLPNFENYIDGDDLEVLYDFGYPVDGYEAPYGKAQFVMIYDTERMESVPVNHEELLEFAKANPGKFTFPAPPDFTGSAFIRNIIYDIVGYEQFMDMEVDKETIAEEIQPAIDYFKELRPYLWREGETYPATISQLENMFADEQVHMTMAYNPNLVPAKILTGEFPETANSFVFEKGTIGNTHFVSIPFNTPNRSGALAVINEILSVEMQASKYNPENWGDLPVLDNSKLSSEERALFDQIQLGKGTLPQDILLDHRVPEVPADMVPIIEEIWMENLL